MKTKSNQPITKLNDIGMSDSLPRFWNCEDLQGSDIQTVRSLTTEEMVEKQVLTSSEAAQFLKVSQKSLYRWLRNGEIPHQKVGGQYRFLKSELARWLKGNIYE